MKIWQVFRTESELYLWICTKDHWLYRVPWHDPGTVLVLIGFKIIVPLLWELVVFAPVGYSCGKKTQICWRNWPSFWCRKLCESDTFVCIKVEWYSRIWICVWPLKSDLAAVWGPWRFLAFESDQGCGFPSGVMGRERAGNAWGLWAETWQWEGNR